ncbi:hypothetical protein ACFV1C_00300 [Streptomyces sp. NPDC059605]|uniref:hypothetical protein n=1 Tax=Streptomyces sp. NPDC059605 TaxID=3346882 RepID=UPI00368EBA51
MSSAYFLLCLSHDPAVITGKYQTPEQALDELESGIEGHSDCDLVIGRISGSLIEVGCPPTHLQHPDRRPCLAHSCTVWADADLLRLLTVVGGTYDGAVREAADAHAFRHWSAQRLHRLRVELGTDR